MENGVIRALKEGTSIITVSFTGDNKYAVAENKTITVIVNLRDASVSVNNSTLDLNVGDTFNIVARTVPRGLNVIYTSSDDMIVTVEGNGKITAHAEGSAIITVGVGGDGIYALNSTNVNVTVSKIPTNINITNNTVVLNVGDGIIRALKEGTSIITVSFAGDYKYAAAENKTFTVIVLRDASVSVNNSTLDLNVDDTFNIVASTVPRGLNVTYTSSDDMIVTVDVDGKITAHAEGSAIITVSVGGDGIYTLNSTNVNVTVSKIPTNINITNDTVVLNVGDNISSGASLIPVTAGNLTYTSSNATVAIVDGTGMIKGLKEGTAVITVSFNGNDQYAPAANKTINVTVKLRNASVSVNKDTLNLNVNDTFDIIATTVPRGLNVIYTTSDASIVSVDADGKVTAKAKGSAIITVSVGGDGVYALNSTTVSVTVNEKPIPPKENLTISASAEPITVGNNATVVVTGLEDATGDVSVIVNGKTYTAHIKAGEATVIVPGLTETVTAAVNYAGDSNYNNASTAVEIVRII